MFGLGPMELGIILFAFVMLFGAKRLPEIGRSMGEAIREFRGAGKELLGDMEDEVRALRDARDEVERAGRRVQRLGRSR